MTTPIQLQNDESVIKTLRRHPVYMVLQIIGIIIIAILILWLLSWLKGMFGATFFTILTVATIIIGALAAFFVFYQYRNDLWLITDQRLVDSTKRNPFNHEVASADLLNVQDIAISKKGFFPTIFNFGEVRCQTASATQVFTLHGVSDPNAVLELIDQTRDNARERAAGMGRRSPEESSSV